MDKTGLFLVFIILLQGSFGMVVSENADPIKVFSAKNRINSLSSSENFVLAGSEDKNSYLFDAYLRLRWRYESQYPVTATAVSEDMMCICTFDNTIKLLDPYENLLWEKTLESYVSHNGAIDLSGDYIAAGTQDGFIYLFGCDGLLWRAKTDAYIVYVKLFPDFLLVVSDKSLYYFDHDANLIKEVPMESYVRSAHVSEDCVVFALGNNKLSVFDIGGNLMWSREMSDQIGSVYSSENYVLAGVKDRNLYVFNMLGELKWNRTLSDSVTWVSMDKRSILASASDDTAYLFKIEGGLIWKYLLKGQVTDYQLTRRGVYLGTSIGEIYYFEPARDSYSSLFVMAVAVVTLIVASLIFFMTLR